MRRAPLPCSTAHGLAVDIGDLEQDDLVRTEAVAIGDARHHRQPARLLDEVGLLDHLVTPQRDLESVTSKNNRRGGETVWSSCSGASAEALQCANDVMSCRAGVVIPG